MTLNKTDVLIVGGGIVGTSTAFFLAQRGISVTLVEQACIGQFASGTNFGNLRRQGRPPFMLPLANRAHEIWPRLSALLGNDVEYDRSGHLRVCFASSPETADDFADYAREVRAYDLKLDVLSGSALRTRFPFLGEDVHAGSYSPDDGHANPRLVSPAFARAAVRKGAAVHENCKITRLVREDMNFHADSAGEDRFVAPVVVLATGAWGHRLAAELGEPVPARSFGPTMSVTEPMPFFVPPSVGVFTSRPAESVYCRQIPRGNVIIGGGHRNPASIETAQARVDPANTLNQLRHIVRLVPRLRDVNIIRVWSGVEGYVDDGLPVIGQSPQTGGLYYAFGFCGSGFQIGPGVGSVLAELIDRGETDVPLDPYRIDRFRERNV